MATKHPKEYWNAYYTEKQFVQGKGPNDFLVQMLPRLQKGKVLDIATGEGQNSVYLAQKGFQVKSFDISEVAVQHAEKLARETGVQIEAKVADMDLFLMGLMEYDSIIMTRFKPAVARYYSEMLRALKHGGTLLIESYGIPEMKEAIPRDESFRDYYFASNEILRHLTGFKILFYQEGEVDGHHVVQCLAQKPPNKDAEKYGFFEMTTKQGQGDSDRSKQLELAEKLFKK